MERIMKRISIFFMTVVLMITGVFCVPKQALADAVIEDEDTKYDRYIAFGQDLSQKEKKAVLDGFGITKEDLDDYKIVEITNEEEHEYLGDYIDASVIGKRALSSVMIVKTEKDSGIAVTTQNISYCTSGMYCNALITAGLEDAKVTVVGPFEISGTSALVGAMKAYAEMTGDDISKSTMDTATNELVATAELADSIGDSKKAAELIAAVKEKIFADGITTKEDIKEAVEECSKALEIELSEQQVNDITNLMEKISKEDIDVDSLRAQAEEIYEGLKEAGLDFSKVDTEGLVEKVGSFFTDIFSAIGEFFTGLFG